MSVVGKIFLFLLLPGIAAATCRPDVNSFYFPLPGAQGIDWALQSTLDLGKGNAIEDEWGARGGDARTYKGHSGVDFDIASFARMDTGVEVHAVASGEVIGLRADRFDREQADPRRCRPERRPWNFVRIRHAGGFVTTYGHLRQNSLRVKVGERVERGQVLAQVGSSGCSAQPHLHFEVQDCRGKAIASLKQKLWQVPPLRENSFHLMELQLLAPSRSLATLLRLPALTTFRPQQTFGVLLSTDGGKPGEELRLLLRGPHGEVVDEQRWPATSALNHRYWYRAFTLSGTKGLWHLDVESGARRLGSRSFNVE